MLTLQINNTIRLCGWIALLVAAGCSSVCAFSAQPAPLIRPLPIEDLGGKALLNFNTALATNFTDEATPLTRIVHYGDSHIASEWFARPLREHWQQDFGVTYDTFGINGARATRPLQWDWTLLAEQYALNPPALIVIGYFTHPLLSIFKKGTFFPLEGVGVGFSFLSLLSSLVYRLCIVSVSNGVSFLFFIRL